MVSARDARHRRVVASRKRTPSSKRPERRKSRTSEGIEERAPRTRIAYPSRNDLSANLARFSAVTPERLGAILRQAELGDTRDWVDFCDRMIAQDGDVRAAIETRTAALSGAAYVIESSRTGDPARDVYAEPAARFVANTVEAMVGNDEVDLMRVGFADACERKLDAVGKGFAFLEIPWEYDEETRITAPKSLIWVHQRRFRFHADDWSPRLVDAGADKTSNYPGLPLEPSRWISYFPAVAGLYPTVSGALRACAWAFVFKRWCLQFWVSGAETFSWPFIWAKVPRGAKEEVRAKAQEGLDNLRADHRAVVDDSIAFELLETAAKDAGTWKQLTDNLNREINKAVLGSTDATEPGKNGAYGAVESRRGTTIEPRLARDERALSESWRRQFFHPLVSYNRHLFGGLMAPVPTVRFTIAAKRREISKNAIDAGVVRYDELRAAEGLEPIGGEEGQRFIVLRPAGPAPAAATAPPEHTPPPPQV